MTLQSGKHLLVGEKKGNPFLRWVFLFQNEAEYTDDEIEAEMKL